MQFTNYMVKRFSFILLFIFISLFSGCDNEQENFDFDALKANEEIQLDETEFPLPVNVFVSWYGETTLTELINDSDLVAVCTVDSIYQAKKSPLLYYGEYGFSGIGQYVDCFVSCYDLTLREVLKGDHSAGEKITFTYPTDNRTLSWRGFLNYPDERMEIGQDYLVFLNCYENSFTDAEHNYTNKEYSIYIIDNDTFTLPENALTRVNYSTGTDNPLEGTTLTELRAMITNDDDPTPGEIIDDFYSDPLNYMTELTDTCCYLSETQLINTSDDIVVGKIVSAEEYNGEISFFSRDKSEVSGHILTVKITENVKGAHKKGQKIKIFVRSDEEKDSLLGGEYVKGTEAVFFLSCMDALSSPHLMNGELQASIVLRDGVVYNRANYTEEAQKRGFIGTWTFNSYRILFSDCFTREQLIEKIRAQIVELPNRITYGEYLTID